MWICSLILLLLRCRIINTCAATSPGGTAITSRPGIATTVDPMMTTTIIGQPQMTTTMPLVTTTAIATTPLTTTMTIPVSNCDKCMDSAITNVIEADTAYAWTVNNGMNGICLTKNIQCAADGMMRATMEINRNGMLQAAATTNDPISIDVTCSADGKWIQNGGMTEITAVECTRICSTQCPDIVFTNTAPDNIPQQHTCGTNAQGMDTIVVTCQYTPNQGTFVELTFTSTDPTIPPGSIPLNPAMQTPITFTCNNGNWFETFGAGPIQSLECHLS